ncbi:MAG TPA: contractile injection system protein, VgrG/Pvc8 family [Pyrinomonadaceae bacterium]|jgi:phage protein D|nr:contractile injection system protein, VgrG/Pvc8 family [Pyrinomonadaceae bacterium]
MAFDAASGLKESRPTIYVGGREQPDLAPGLLGLLIAEQTSGLYRCEAKFSNWGLKDSTTDFLYFDRRLLDFGKQFQVKLGGDTLFDGRVTALEADFPEAGPPTLTVLAEDRFQDLRMTRRTRTFEDVTDSDVINQIAGDHGLSPSVSVTGPTYKVLAQVNQSDLAFLRERARSIDAELWMDAKTLNAKSHPTRGGTPKELKHGSGLRSFTVLADLATQRTSVAVNGWDVAGKEALHHEATDSVIGGELDGDESGVSILQAQFGARKEALAHTVPLNSREAQAAAETFFKASARRFVVGRGVAETDAALRAGGSVRLQKIGPMFEGRYYLTEVRHVFDLAKGLRTEFTGERPGIGRP